MALRTSVWWTQLGVPRLKNLWLRDLLVNTKWTDPAWCHLNCCLCCSWCVLKPHAVHGLLAPVWENAFHKSGSDVLSTFTSQARPESLHTHHDRPNGIVCAVFIPRQQLCWRLWSTKKFSPSAWRTKWNDTTLRYGSVAALCSNRLIGSGDSNCGVKVYPDVCGKCLVVIWSSYSTDVCRRLQYFKRGFVGNSIFLALCRASVIFSSLIFKYKQNASFARANNSRSRLSPGPRASYCTCDEVWSFAVYMEIASTEMSVLKQML